MRPGQLERHIYDYTRHGTTDLFAALDIKAGTVIAEVHRRHRSMEFRYFLQTVERATPAELDHRLVLDNASTHKTLTVLGYGQGLSLDYALRFLGDLSSNGDFLTLLNNTRIDGFRAAFRFDGTYTDIARMAEVPEPSTLALLLPAGVALALQRRRRKNLTASSV